MTYTYCATADVTPLLGDMELPSTLDIPGLINKASADVTLWLGTKYELPLQTTADDYTTLLLTESTSELTAAYVILSQAQGGEDNRINAYGKHLWDRSQSRLMPYMTNLALPGTTIRVTTATKDGPVAVYNADSRSQVENYYLYTQHPPLVDPNGYGYGFPTGFGEVIYNR